MTNKEKYRALCKKESTIALFQTDWWLDSVCGEEWDVCLVEKGELIMAALPYHTKSKYGLKLLTHPHLTQHLGPWFRPQSVKYGKLLGKQKDYIEELVAQLPKFDYFNQNWSYCNTNWLPFFWLGFEQTTRYTYVIEDLTDLSKVWGQFESKVRGDVRKAEKNGVRVDGSASLSEFMQLNKQVFERQGLDLPYDESFVDKLIEEAGKRNQARWFVAKDESNRNHAGVLIVWDENSAYYIMGGGDPNLRNSGATSLCMWEAIKFASSVTKKFDFEGSMIEPVERFFRGFGAKQKHYFTVSKVNSLLVHLGMSLMKIKKILKLERQ
ncbi:methicillin resistance protein [Vibrio galatheae]|uniref:Methicillin resistance protein n=1 Tax=Vibrio galatheae TaxID=579748 RepID=A0A0F4NPY8_9VIBR|nr:GNAT family N-acetyltransferase [Vibrio galatheae]KJY84156.1 methicillin resistance protein [Vibrio galatheae]